MSLKRRDGAFDHLGELEKALKEFPERYARSVEANSLDDFKRLAAISDLAVRFTAELKALTDDESWKQRSEPTRKEQAINAIAALIAEKAGLL